VGYLLLGAQRSVAGGMLPNKTMQQTMLRIAADRQS